MELWQRVGGEACNEWNLCVCVCVCVCSSWATGNISTCFHFSCAQLDFHSIH